jgi:hypothetical protein
MEKGESRLILSILESWGSDKEVKAWQDDDHSKLERKMAEIAVKMVLLAEVRYREAVVRQHYRRGFTHKVIFSPRRYCLLVNVNASY